MASLTVRKLDEALKAQLRLRAARNGRSVEDEVRVLLRAAVDPSDDSPAEDAAPKPRPVSAQSSATPTRRTREPWPVSNP